MNRKTLSVTGMSCTGCERNAESALKRLDSVTRVEADHAGNTVEVVVGIETAYAMGYSKPSPDFQFGTSDAAFGTPGAGGSFGFADPDAELGFAYTPNRMGHHLKDDPREVTLRDAVYECIRSRGSETAPVRT